MAISFHFMYKDNLFPRITGEVGTEINWQVFGHPFFWKIKWGSLYSTARIIVEGKKEIFLGYTCWSTTHFFVPSSLCFKARLSALYMIWKWIFHSHANKTHFNNSFSNQRHSLKVRVFELGNCQFQTTGKQWYVCSSTVLSFWKLSCSSSLWGRQWDKT